jgi:hypothetical protein
VAKSCVSLSFDRLTPTVLLVVQESVGLFRSAGGLVLLSGGKLGPQISCRSCRPSCPRIFVSQPSPRGFWGKPPRYRLVYSNSNALIVTVCSLRNRPQCDEVSPRVALDPPPPDRGLIFLFVLIVADAFRRRSFAAVVQPLIAISNGLFRYIEWCISDVVGNQ